MCGRSTVRLRIHLLLSPQSGMPNSARRRSWWPRCVASGLLRSFRMLLLFSVAVRHMARASWTFCDICGRESLLYRLAVLSSREWRVEYGCRWVLVKETWSVGLSATTWACRDLRPTDCGNRLSACRPRLASKPA